MSHIFEDDAGIRELQRLASSSGLTLRDSSIDSDNRNRATSPDYIKSAILAPRIRWSSVLVVYVSEQTKSSEFVDWEIRYAHRIVRRIIGVWGRGQTDCQLPDALEKYADAIVGWDSDRIVDAICGDDSPWMAPTGDPIPARPIRRVTC